MKHPFAQLKELNSAEKNAVSGACRLGHQIIENPYDAHLPESRKRPFVATTMAVGEEGGCFPDWDVK